MDYKNTPSYGSSNYSGSFEDITVCFNPLAYNGSSSNVIHTPSSTIKVEHPPVINRRGDEGSRSGGDALGSISILDICCAPCGLCCFIN